MWEEYDTARDLDPGAASRPRLESLKIACLALGIAIDQSSLSALGGAEALTVHEYATTGGIPIRVGPVYINAPFDSPSCLASPVRLSQCRNGFQLEYLGHHYSIDDILPLPSYLGAHLSTGRPASDVVMSHGDRIRLSPIKGCAYDCGFCDLGELRYERRGFEELREALELALGDDNLRPRHVLISGGSPGPRHVEWFNELCAEIIKSSPLPVDVMFSPQDKGEDTIDQLVDAGVHSVSINIELFDETSALAHLRRKRETAFPYFERTVRRAVERIGRNGRVRSLIIPGLESEEATIAGVEFLAGLGVHPVLSPFRPATNTRLAGSESPSPDSLRRILAEARAVASRHGVALGPACTVCQHNTLTFPWDCTGCDDPH